MKGIANICIVATALALAGCSQQTTTVQTTNAIFKNGESRTEPVIYNGKRYNVSLNYQATGDTFDIGVGAHGGRALGGTPGDQKIIENVASSTLRHYACKDGEKGRIVPGSQKHLGKTWQVQGQCQE